MGMPSAAAVRGVGIGASKLDHAADLAETYLGGTASTSTPGFLNMGLKVPFGVTAGICRELRLHPMRKHCLTHIHLYVRIISLERSGRNVCFQGRACSRCW